MSNDSSPSPRRLTIAISAAAVSMTLAVGVTAGSLLGWFHPASEATAPPMPEVQPPAADQTSPPTSPVILVPVAPEQPVAPAPAPLPPIEELAADSQVALHERHHDDDEHEGRTHERHDREDEDDDD